MRSRNYLVPLLLLLIPFAIQAEESILKVAGKSGPGKGKHIVLISGDEEYRSEEALPMLAHILAKHHGFDCTVLFAVDPDTGEIDPNNSNNIPGMENLADADLCILFTRFRELPDEDMKYFEEFLKAGKPIIGLRTATHAFNYKNTKSPYAKYSWRSGDWKGGFGQQVLGETWVSHHGKHKFESTRGVVESDNAKHPILRGIDDVWGPTDVYGVVHLPGTETILLRGQVLDGMEPDSKPVDNMKNNPMMPLVWLKPYQLEGGKQGTALCSTFGSSVDFKSEDGRRLVVNATYFLLGLGDQIVPDANVEIIGPYEPTFYGFGKFKKGQKPSDFQLD